MKKICEALVIMIGTLGWWGFVYPDLCLTDDVYEQEYAEGEKEGQIQDSTLAQREPETKKDLVVDSLSGDGQGDKSQKQGKPAAEQPVAVAQPVMEEEPSADKQPQVVERSETEKGAEPEATGEGPGSIRIKSRLWEYLCGEVKVWK